MLKMDTGFVAMLYCDQDFYVAQIDARMTPIIFNGDDDVVS